MFQFYENECYNFMYERLKCSRDAIQMLKICATVSIMNQRIKCFLF